MAGVGAFVPGGQYNQFNTSADQYRLNDLPPDIAVEEQALNRRQQIANLLMSHATQPIQTGQMAGRFFVPPSWAQGANQLGQALAGTYLTNVNDESRQNLSAQNQQQTAQAIQDYIQKTSPRTVTTPGQAAVPERTVPTELEGPGAPISTGIQPGEGYTPEELAQPRAGYGSLKDALMALHEARKPPYTFNEGPRPMGEKTLPAQVAIPATSTTVSPTAEERRQADVAALTSNVKGLQNYAQTRIQQEAVAKEHELQREAVHRENVNKIDADLEKSKNHIDMMVALKVMSAQDGAQAKKDADERHAELMKELRASQSADFRYGVDQRREAAELKAKEKSAKTLPGSVGAKFMENSQNLRMAERAQGLLEGNIVEGVKGDPNAVGLKGYIPDVVLQRADPGGVETRAAVANLGSMIIHDRSGAAVTASEYPRLRPFIPTDKDDADTAKKKLGQFITEYKKIDEEMTQFYSEAGYQVPEHGWHQSPGSSAAPAAPSESGGLTPAEQQELDALKKKYGR